MTRTEKQQMENLKNQAEYWRATAFLAVVGQRERKQIEWDMAMSCTVPPSAERAQAIVAEAKAFIQSEKQQAA